jgi:hypothetical protein
VVIVDDGEDVVEFDVWGVVDVEDEVGVENGVELELEVEWGIETVGGSTREVDLGRALELELELGVGVGSGVNTGCGVEVVWDMHCGE